MSTHSTTNRGDVVNALADLVHGNVLTSVQADWLAEHWADLPADWASHPYLRTVSEHTRAYIDSLRDFGLWLATRQGAIS
ncbi:MAG TPA: hypothetical protein VFF79_18240 [Conexibacter sp.]|jgi:hypothetical protein|nr:hypothetical protein [Conexibacter sp.]